MKKIIIALLLSLVAFGLVSCAEDSTTAEAYNYISEYNKLYPFVNYAFKKGYTTDSEFSFTTNTEAQNSLKNGILKNRILFGVTNPIDYDATTNSFGLQVIPASCQGTIKFSEVTEIPKTKPETCYSVEFEDIVLGLKASYEDLEGANKERNYAVSFSGTVVIDKTRPEKGIAQTYYDITVSDVKINNVKYPDISFSYDKSTDDCTFECKGTSFAENMIRPFVQLYPSSDIFY